MTDMDAKDLELFKTFTKSIRESKNDYIGVQEATEKVNSSLGNMITSYGELSKRSTLWGFMSRMVSGVLPGFWSLQNKFRGVGLAIFMMNERSAEAIKKQTEMMETVGEMDDRVKRLTSSLEQLAKAEAGNADENFTQMKDYQSYTKFFGERLGIQKLSLLLNRKLAQEETNLFNINKKSFKLRRDSGKLFKKTSLKIPSQFKDTEGKKIPWGSLTGLGRKRLAGGGIERYMAEVHSKRREKGRPRHRRGRKPNAYKNMQAMLDQKGGAFKMRAAGFADTAKGQKQMLKFYKNMDPEKGFMKQYYGFQLKNVKENLSSIFNKENFKKGIKNFFDGWKKVMVVIGKVLLFIAVLALVVWAIRQSGMIEGIKENWHQFIFIWENALYPLLEMVWKGIVDIWDGIQIIFKDGEFLNGLLLLATGFLRIAAGTLGFILMGLLTIAWGLIISFFGETWTKIKEIWNGDESPLTKIWLLIRLGFGHLIKFMSKVILIGGALLIGIAVIASGMSFLTAGIAMAGIALAAGLLGRAGNVTGGYAKGGSVFKTGKYLVGEEGPELVTLPAGARVHNNANTRKMMGNNITVNVQGRVGASDTELRDIARKVGRLVSQEINRTTSSSTVHR